MSRITKALDKLRQKCTEAGMEPAGNGTADILECIAEHFAVTGGNDEYELKSYTVGSGKAVSSSELKTTLDPNNAADAELIAALKSPWRIVGNSQSSGVKPYYVETTSYHDTMIRWGTHTTSGASAGNPVTFDTATNELILSTNEGKGADLSYLAPKA